MDRKDKYIRNFDLAFSGLSEGGHFFEYWVDDKFFEYFSFDGTTGGDVNIDVHLIKRSTFIQLDLNIKGKVKSTCDRCLGSLDVRIESNEEMFIKFGEYQDDDDNIIWVDQDEDHINLVDLIYELIHVVMPLRKTHDEGQCNPDYILTEPKEEEGRGEIDPRWEKLKELKKKQKN
ncbi:MAG TPA: hypothetical protein DDX92_04385 [Flavobacteriales bacterium]|jgi:uncharacterized protein|nr:hypothetical protein [Flavobacteriales bacterium]